MATFNFTATTARTSDEVFAFLADMTNAPSWDASISSSVRRDMGDVDMGSSFRVTLGFLGRDLVLDYQIVTFEPPRTVVLRAESGIFISQDTVSITALEGGGCRVHYEAQLLGKGLTKLFDPFFKLSINHFGKQAGAKLLADYLR